MCFKRKFNIALYFIFTVILVLFDQFTKYLATDKLKNNKPFVIIKDIFEFRYLEGGNKGAAWGILSGHVGLFIGITIIVIIIIALIIFKIENSLNNMVKHMDEVSKNSNSEVINLVKKFTFTQFIMVLLLSGAVGNLIDRIANQSVVDFIYFKLINFPIFNVADCYVTVSAFILIILFAFIIKDREFEKILKNK